MFDYPVFVEVVEVEGYPGARAGGLEGFEAYY